MRKLLVVLAILFGVSSMARAQDGGATPQPSQQAPTFRSGVELVTVDVGVIDQTGKPVDDLHAADFTVKIDGQVRRVESVNLVRIDPEAAKKKLAEKEETVFTSNLTPPEGRQIIFAIDQVNVRPGTLKILMRTAAQFVDKLSPIDQVAFRAYPEPGARVPFTTDRLRVKLAMDSLIGHQDPKAQPRMNIGVTEALAIDEKRDEQTLLDVTRRECAGMRSPDAIEQCKREIATQASDIAFNARETAETGLRGLLDLLRELAFVDGAKTLILLSEGVAVSNPADLDLVSILAGRARVALNVLIVDEQRGDVSIARMAPTAEADRRRETTGLQNIAAASRGAVFHAVGTAEGVFERLLREISAYYVLGVEQRPGDTEDKRHRIDVEVARRGVTIRSPQAFALSAAARPKRSPEDNVQSALTSPFAVSEIPLRVTTFAQQDPSSSKVRVSVAADVGQPGTPSAEYAVAYLLIDRDNRIASSFARKLTLGGSTHPATEPLPFVSTANVDPGIYTLRLAVVDRDGRRGSVIREVSAWKLRDEEFAVSDLVVGNPPTPGEGLRLAVEPHLDADAIAAFVEMYATAPASLENVTTMFEIADDPDSPALARFAGTLRPGSGEGSRIAQAFIPTVALPPGRYVARVEVTREGKRLTVLSRPFVLERAATTVAGVPATPPALFVSSALGKFDRAAVLRPELVSPMLDDIEKRSPALKDAMAEARAGRYGPAAIEALTAGDQEAAAFLRGFDFFTKGQLDQAAAQLQLAAGPRRQFFPAAFYLGAVFAAAGRDRDAAGTWQLALGTEPRPAIAYTLAAEARIRDNQPDAAIDILKPAYARTPTDDEIGRRLAMAYLLTSRYSEALPIVDGYLSRHPTDQDFLFAGVVSQYEVVRAGAILSNADRDRIRRWANAYRGPQSALVEKYLQTMGAR
jgi:VWFA-related protein